MLIERILSGVMLLAQLGALVWSVVICVQAVRTRRKISRIIKLWEEESRADRDARRM